ncbi:conserved hypothetical protein [Ricinus communis]|uniref:Uncharacterized protein n=1 Tax=Ricinus communis TaxID=3988 RepID=B9T170_RICCO|nr:conserved hypothetical protein [Ricinus communis]|eukprot:XP_002531996.1 uncharacterized protein LOC8275942 [Ricinus communis]
MENKEKKDHKIATATTAHEPDSNDLLSKEEQNQASITFGTKDIGASSPSHDNAPSLNQQYPPFLQWPCTPQNNVDQPPSSSNPCASSQSPPSIAVSQRHQLPHLQLNPASHEGHTLPHLAQSSTPFWLSQHPGYHLPGVNAPSIIHPFTPIGTTNSSWPASNMIGGEPLSKDHPQVPNLCHQVGYTYPSFPGPWDPSFWWGHVQLSQPPNSYSFPGAYGHISLQPSTKPGCSAPLGQSSQIGVTSPPAILSQKQEQLWSSQSIDKVQLQTVIGHLQSVIADHKSRIMKLEAEVASLKQAAEVPTVHDTVSRQPSKRGRPRRTVTSVDTLPSPDASQPHTRGRKPKADIFEKVILKRPESTVKLSNQTAIAQQEVEKVSNVIANSNSDIGINGSNIMVPCFQNQVHQEISQMQLCVVALDSSLEMKINDGKTGDTNDASAILTQQAKGTHHRFALASSLAAENNKGNALPYTITSKGNGRNVLNSSSCGFCDSDSAIREGQKIVPGWSFANEEDASEELDDAVAASAKDENEEEMGDNDGSSDSEELPKQKVKICLSSATGENCLLCLFL